MTKAYIIGKTAEREAADGRQDGDKNGWQSRGTIKRKTDGIGFGRSLGGGMVGGRREGENYPGWVCMRPSQLGLWPGFPKAPPG